MNRKLIIATCEYCPYLWNRFKEYKCLLTKKEIKENEVDTIPDHCPLEATSQPMKEAFYE